MTKLHLAILTFALLLSNFGHAKDWVYVVVKEDNLWDIAKTHLDQVQYYKGIKRLNNIQQPRRMQPGTVLRIPLEWVTRNAAKVSIIHMSGEHKLLREKELLVVEDNTEFHLGDELRVSNSGNVTLMFADGSEMTLSKGVIVRFDHLTQYGKSAMVDTRLRLEQGKIEIRAEKQTGVASRLDITTASAVTSVRGTVFRVAVDNDNNNASIVEVVEGEVAVAKGEETVAVKEGFAVKVKESEQISAPVQLPVAPTFLPFNEFISELNTIIKWLPVDNAEKYQLQLAKDENISNLVYEETTTNNEFSLPKLGNGNYFLRLTAFTQDALEGLPSIKPISIGLEPFSSIPVPLLKGVSNDESQYISWRQPPTNTSIELQVATKKDFSNAKRVNVVGKNKYKLVSDIIPIQYFRARNKHKQTMQYSDWSKPCKISSETKMILCGI